MNKLGYTHYGEDGEGLSGDEKKREGQAAGARAWVVKPFKPEVLLNAVQKLILP